MPSVNLNPSIVIAAIKRQQARQAAMIQLGRRLQLGLGSGMQTKSFGLTTTSESNTVLYVAGGVAVVGAVAAYLALRKRR